jgi:hypothetical protein
MRSDKRLTAANPPLEHKPIPSSRSRQRPRTQGFLHLTVLVHLSVMLADSFWRGNMKVASASLLARLVSCSSHQALVPLSRESNSRKIINTSPPLLPLPDEIN